MTPPAAGLNLHELDYMSWGPDESSLPIRSYPLAPRTGNGSYFDELAIYDDPTFSQPEFGNWVTAEDLHRNFGRGNDAWRTGFNPSRPAAPVARSSMGGSAASAEPSLFLDANRGVAHSSPSAHDGFLVSPVSPVSSIEPVKRTGSADWSSAGHHSPEVSNELDYLQPAKRIRSHASEGAGASKPRTVARKAQPSSPEIKKPTVLSRSAPSGVAKRRPKKPTPNPNPYSAAPAVRNAGAGGGVSHNRTQLRTAQRRVKPPTQSGAAPARHPASEEDGEEPDDDPLAPEERRARESHNFVEKQYRSRLNQQFESLLAVLLAGKDARSGGGGGTRWGDASAAAAADDRRLSKAEVLEKARRRIEDLEELTRTLALEKEELLGNLEVMRGIVERGADADV